jgi:orotate phosphoribosyltransferase
VRAGRSVRGVTRDVVTTGGSTLNAASKLRDAGYHAAGVVALVDRLEGGRRSIEEAELNSAALFTREDFIPAPAKGGSSSP